MIVAKMFNKKITSTVPDPNSWIIECPHLLTHNFTTLLTGDMYPWQACLDEATKCYYYWNVETNEVQWHPPEQLSSTAPDTQTAEDDYLPAADREEKREQGYQEDKGHDAGKGDWNN